MLVLVHPYPLVLGSLNLFYLCLSDLGSYCKHVDTSCYICNPPSSTLTFSQSWEPLCVVTILRTVSFWLSEEVISSNRGGVTKLRYQHSCSEVQNVFFFAVWVFIMTKQKGKLPVRMITAPVSQDEVSGPPPCRPEYLLGSAYGVKRLGITASKSIVVCWVIIVEPPEYWSVLTRAVPRSKQCVKRINLLQIVGSLSPWHQPL